MAFCLLYDEPMNFPFFRKIAVFATFLVCAFAHAGFKERDAKITDHLLARGFSIQESTVSGLLEIAKANGKVGEVSFTFSPVLQLKEFLPFSPATLNQIVSFIERSDAGEFSLQRPQEFIQLIFASTLLPSEILSRLEIIARTTTDKTLKLTVTKNLILRNFHIETMTKNLLLLSLDREETISLPATLELLNTDESKWAEERMITFLSHEKSLRLLAFLLRNGDHFSEMSDQLILNILKSVDVKTRTSLLAAMQLKQFDRAQKIRRSALTKMQRCLLYLSPVNA